MDRYRATDDRYINTIIWIATHFMKRVKREKKQKTHENQKYSVYIE